MTAEPKPANQATLPIPHKTAAIVADRCGFIIPNLQTLRLSQLAQASMRLAKFFESRYDQAMAIAAVHQFFPKSVARMQRAAESN
jgi:hypothetical protein